MGDLLSSENVLIVSAISLVIPGLVTVLTRWDATDGVKNVVHALVSALAGIGFDFCRAVLDGNHSFSLRSALVMSLMAWGASTFTYLKLWRNSSAHVALVNSTDSFGFGKDTLTDQFIATALLGDHSDSPGS